jgi:hypothetical protein
MYHYQCDWCGESIDVKLPYVRAAIEVVTTARSRLGEREKVIEPTRFFHAHDLRGVEEFDRLGIEVKDQNLGDCCYTRALRQIEGVGPDTLPDMGLEWRLVPVGAEIASPSPRRSRKQPPPDGPWNPDAVISRFVLGLSPKVKHAVRRARINTVEQIEGMSDEEILRLDGIGYGTLCKMRELVDAQTPESPGGKPAKAGGV